MTLLPEADTATREYFIHWLETFAGYVRDVDYAAARPLFHPDVLAFGTHRDIISGARGLAIHPMGQCVAEDLRLPLRYGCGARSDDIRQQHGHGRRAWTSTGYHQDGSTFDRPGRATMVFHQNGAWLCTHSHMSLNRGVPQQSFASRPVKAGWLEHRPVAPTTVAGLSLRLRRASLRCRWACSRSRGGAKIGLPTKPAALRPSGFVG